MIRRGYADRLAEDVIERVGVKQAPVDPFDIAKQLGARVVSQPDADGKSGLVARKGSEIIVGVNSAHAKVRQRFTVAHEIGHMLLHANQPLIIDDGGYALIGERSEGQTSPLEVEANAFAASLLMPADWVRRAVKENPIDLSDDAGMKALARKFDVSQQAMMWRLVNLGLLKNF